MNKNRKWTKERLEKFRATMKAKRARAVRLGKAMSFKEGHDDVAHSVYTISLPNVNGALSVIEKWNKEADAVFAALPFEKKSYLLGKL